MEWTDEIVTRLRVLWEQGLSTAEIGRQLNVTKNAVVGKAHRLGLEGRPSPIRKVVSKKEKQAGEKKQEGSDLGKESGKKVPKKSRTDSAVDPKTSKQDEPVEKIEAKAKKPKKLEFISLNELPSYRKSNSECCWPIGNPGEKDFHFCKQPVVPGKPYCLKHVQVAYVKLKDRKNNSAS